MPAPAPVGNTYEIVLDVDRTEPLKTGSRNGRPWTLFAVHGRNTTPGVNPTGPLRTFDHLPNGPVAVICQPMDDGSITVKRMSETHAAGQRRNGSAPKPQTPGTPEPRLSWVMERLADLESRLDDAEGKLAHICTGELQADGRLTHDGDSCPVHER